MIWFLLAIPALWVLWRIMEWDAKGRTTLSFGVLLFYACALASVLPIAVMYQAYKYSPPPPCTCEMVKNHECLIRN